MDLNEMIKYYYSSAKIRQENSKNVINREVTSAKDDIQVRNPRTTTTCGPQGRQRTSSWRTRNTRTRKSVDPF